MYFNMLVFMLVALCNQILGANLDRGFNVDIPSYDEYSEWELLPTIIVENKSTENKSKDLPDITNKTEENKINNVFLILEEIKERLEVINEPLKVLKQQIIESNKPENEIKEEPLEDVKNLEEVMKKASIKDKILPEVINESLADVIILEALKEPLQGDEKDILERDVILKIEPGTDGVFAGPVKAKGSVSVGANFDYESSYPMDYPYFPPYFYGPFYYPLPYYYPLPPTDPHDLYIEFLRRYFGIPSKRFHEVLVLPDCDPEGSEIASHWQASGKNEANSGKPFSGFVPASGRISIAAHY